MPAISRIICINKDKKEVLWKKGVEWNKNKNFLYLPRQKDVPAGKDVIEGRLDMDEYIKKSGTRLSFKKAKAILMPEEIIEFKNLYPGHENYIIVFEKDGTYLNLIMTGSKTVEEFRAIGHDSYNKSKVPLVLSYEKTDSGVKFFPLNL